MCVSKENRVAIDLNVEAKVEEGGLEVTAKPGGNMGDEERYGERENRADDPFDLIPIIEAVMKTKKGRKMTSNEIEYVEPVENYEPQRNRPRKAILAEEEETSLEGSPRSP